MHGVARRDDHHGRTPPGGREQVEDERLDHVARVPRRRSAIRRVRGEVRGELRLPAVAVREQLFLVVEQLLAGLGGELEIRPLDDRIDRAGLLAQAAIDALRHVDVVARRAAAAVVARLGLDRDRLRRADRLAQLAGDAALLAVRDSGAARARRGSAG